MWVLTGEKSIIEENSKIDVESDSSSYFSDGNNS